MSEIVEPPRAGQTAIFARIPFARNRAWVGVLAAVILSGIAYVLRVAVDDVLPPGFPYVTFFPAVVLAAFFFGTRSGVIAAVLCGLVSWYYFIPPANAFKMNSGTIAALSLYTFVVVVDVLLIHWTHTAYGALEREKTYSSALAENRELLFRELQHRVGNNLQMVAAMLTLQKRGLTGDAALAIEQAARRIQTIGATQRELYRHDGSSIMLVELVEKVSRDALIANGRDDVTLEFAHRGDAPVAPEEAIPATVILAETVGNAIEHGLIGRAGSITVSTTVENGEAAIDVTDDGGTLPHDFTLDQSSSLGLRLAGALARQLRGSYRLTGDSSRTTASLRFPLAA